MSPGQYGQHAGHESLPIVGRDSKQKSAGRVGGAVEVENRLLVGPQDVPGVDEQALAFRSRPDACSLAPQESVTDLVLEFLHLQAERRLGTPHDVRGSREAARLHDRHEGPQEIDIQHCPKLRPSRGL
jgi:hypothetical protein